jgi:putative ABC transport system permease protein
VSEIVGVARHVRSRPDEREPMVQVYVPLAQVVVGDVYLLVRPAAGASDALVAPVRAAIGRVDREQLVGIREIFTLADLAWTATDRYRFRATMVATFAGLALVLAMAGVFGTSAYTVQQRLRDFAVRRALGATSGDVLRLVAAGIAPVFGLGVLAGVLAALALGRVLTTVLYGVDPIDPLTFGTAAGVLALACVLAVAVPARRALRIDPARVLRGS